MNKRQRKLTALFTAFLLLFTLVMPNNFKLAYGDDNSGAGTGATQTTGGTTQIQIFGTTDLHGKFDNYNYPIDATEAGGLTQISEVIEAGRATNSNTIVVDNGDAIQGNYNHLFTTKEYEGRNPMGIGFTKIKYDAVSLGNHEFNFGMDYLNKYVEQVGNGICANLYKDDKRVFDAFVMKEVAGIKVAIIGVVSPHITKWDGDKLQDYTPTNPAEEVAKVIAEIKKSENKADLYIVSAHVGLTSEYGNGDSATDIANANPEVSLILAGHSHATIPGKDGKDVKVNKALIIQPTNAGKAVAKATLEVEKDTDGKYSVVSSKSEIIKLMDNSPVDEELVALLKPYHDTAIADARSVIGTLDKDLADANEFKFVPQSFASDQGVTDLINEVQLYYSNKHLESKGIDPSKVHRVSAAAMLSATANMKAGDITKAGVAQIYKFDNTLYTVKTNIKELKKYMEWTAGFYNTFKSGDLNISFNKDMKDYNYDMFAGINYEINIANDAEKRIENITYADGTAAKDEDVIYLTVNNYRYNTQLKGIFEAGQFELIYESTNDQLSAVRDMITDYIINVKDGKLLRNVDNNWKLTGAKYPMTLRAKVIELINKGVIPVTDNGYGVTNTSLNWNNMIENIASSGKKSIDIISFNDFHGSVLESGKNVGAAKLSGVINRYKSLANDNYGVIPVAAGDLYQGSAISNIKYGAPVTDMLKAIGIEASAIGNHEFDWGTDKISNWAKEGDFDFLAANIVKKGTDTIADYAKPYKIVEQNGVKIGIIGIATPETATKTLAENVKDIEFQDPVKTVMKYEKIVRDAGAQVVVVLSHSAVYQDSKTYEVTGEAADMAKIKGVDAVIGAHNHTFAAGYVNETPVVEGGYNGRGLAQLRFVFDDSNELVTVLANNEIFLGNEKNLPVDEALADKIAAHKAELDPIMSQVVTTLEERLSHDEVNSNITQLGVVVAETMRQITGTQIGLTNGGGIRRSLEKGNVTIGDMYEILPFDNTLVTLEVTGEELVQLIEHGVNTKGFGWGQFAGIKVWYDKETGKVSSIRLNDGTKIEKDKYYTVTVNDFMITGGDGYDFSKAKDIKDTHIVMRDAMTNLWKEKGVPKVDYAILIAGVDDTKDVPTDNPEDKPKEDKLPQTGMPIGTEGFVLIGLISTGIGAVAFKRRKKVS